MGTLGSQMTRVAVIPAMAVVALAAGTASADAHDAAHVPAQVATAAQVQGPTQAGMTVEVTVPVVGFVQTIVARSGHVRTPVVITDGGVIATATVVPGSRCTVSLVPAVTAWIDCDVHAGDSVMVTTSDGRTYTKAIDVT